jgi:hypothetical protein
MYPPVAKHFLALEGRCAEEAFPATPYSPVERDFIDRDDLERRIKNLKSLVQG